MKIAVTGGAGYIGAHVVKLLLARGDDVVIVDDLVTGNSRRVEGVPIVQLDIARAGAEDLLTDLFLEQKTEAVFHFAGRKQVSESVAEPTWYYQQNVGGFAQLLAAMRRARVLQLINSSSAAVYGAVVGDSIDETARCAPINPYGETKLTGEWLAAAAADAFGMNIISLRYFNVAGAGAPTLGDNQALNLFPMVFDRIEAGLPPLVFGDDYPTPDGTCVRDYVHVQDLAEAHVAALEALPVRPGHTIYNIGTGDGNSVLEVIDAIASASGIDIAPSVEPRRAGDPARVVASAVKAKTDLNWEARHSLTEIARSAWQARVAQRKSDASSSPPR